MLVVCSCMGMGRWVSEQRNMLLILWDFEWAGWKGANSGNVALDALSSLVSRVLLGSWDS